MVQKVIANLVGWSQVMQREPRPLRSSRIKIAFRPQSESLEVFHMMRSNSISPSAIQILI